MAKNDIILVDGIVAQRRAENNPSDKNDEVFEYLVLEEVLKDYDFSPEEIESGWIDGDGDGGIDGFYVIVNGHLLDDLTEFVWPKANAAIEVWVITCKHHATFQQATLDALIATIEEIFDFSLEDHDLKGSYSNDLLSIRSDLMAAYRKLSIGRPTVSFSVVYGSRGDSANVGESVRARAQQIENMLRDLFSSASVQARFFGAAEIVESHRRAKSFALDLPFLEHLATGKESYVLLVKLSDYWKFVSDEKGNLRRYLFDSNVRDYLGANSVNEEIARSLADPTAPDFWWLNNGVTILATNATIPGKTIQLQDIQIVNGLQTTETIFKHFHEGGTISSERALLVKIIVSSDVVARDRIIRATNNQSPVETASLHATDKIQRDIEEILERHDWYYERRKNYFKNIGKPPGRVVTATYLASAVVTLVFRNVHQGTRIKAKFMRDQASYDDVFSRELPLKIWPVLIGAYKRIDAALVHLVPEQKRRERAISNWRPMITLLVVGRILGSFDYTIDQLASLDVSHITDAHVKEALDIVTLPECGLHTQRKVRFSSVIKCCEVANSRFGIIGVERVGRRSIRKTIPSGEQLASSTIPVIPPEELIKAVDGALPTQPWKPGVHVYVAEKLGVGPKDVHDSIQTLIARGIRYRQKDGVVYDREGKVITTDPNR